VSNDKQEAREESRGNKGQISRKLTDPRFLTMTIEHEKAFEHSLNESSANGNGLSFAIKFEAVEVGMAA